MRLLLLLLLLASSSELCTLCPLPPPHQARSSATEA
jgi:hypothetical protein